MRIVLGAFALVLIAAGALVFVFSRPERSAAQACRLNARHELNFTSASARDAVSVEAVGASCAGATATLILADARGAELYRYSTDYLALAYGGPRPEGAPDVASEEVRSFLGAWADVSLSHAGVLPAWPEGAAQLSSVDAGALRADTPLAREPYEAARRADTPTLCFAASLEVTHCLVYDARTRKAQLLAALGPRGARLLSPS